MSGSKLFTAAEVSKEIMDAAIRAHVVDGMSQNSAAKTYGVCRMTMRNRLQKKHPGRSGGQTKFPARVEKELVDLLLACCDMGIPLNRSHCIQLFSQVAIELGLEKSGCNPNTFRNFLKRHKQISMRITHASNRKQDREWTMDVCEEYVSKLQKLYDEGFLQSPEQVWNMDETAFDTSRMVDKVVGRTGMKQIPSQFDGNAKECVTILPCGNAAGLQLKFLALYSGKLHLKSRLEDTFNMCYHAVNESGYMDQLIFANYIKKTVFPAMTAEKNVIFVDGHYSHVNNLLLVRYCREFSRESGKRVEVFCFPSGQTSRLQPFDVSAFGGIKFKWNRYLCDRRVKPGGMVTKDNFLSHVVMLWFHTEGFPKEFAFNAGPSLQSGFEKCGLYPFNPDVIRSTVKPYNDPSVLESELRHVPPHQSHDKLFELLRTEYSITADEQLHEVKDCIENLKKGINSGKVIAAAVAKSLMDEAPKKKRKEKNTMLRLKAGALVTSDEMVKEMEAESARKLAVREAAKAIKAAKRKAPEPEDSPESEGKKTRKVAVKKPKKK